MAAYPIRPRDRPPGSLLGEEQRDWFLQALENSKARWKLWGNALPLIPMRLDLSTLPFTGYEDSIFAIDAWAGYPYELNYLMRQLQEQQIYRRGFPVRVTITCTGPAPSAGPPLIRRPTRVSVDFTVAGISSTPLFEDLTLVAQRQTP